MDVLQGAAKTREYCCTKFFMLVAFIVRGKVSASVVHYQTVSDRILGIRLKAHPVDMVLVQVYAPTSEATEEEMEVFYDDVAQLVKEQKKSADCLIIMGDLNGKVGAGKEDDIIGPYGIGTRNRNGQLLVDCSRRHNLMDANTWFQAKANALHTWTSPDGRTKNQIDYVLVDKRYRNGIQNCKAKPGADCGSDHNPVVVVIKIKLKKSQEICQAETLES